MHKLGVVLPPEVLVYENKILVPDQVMVSFTNQSYYGGEKHKEIVSKEPTLLYYSFFRISDKNRPVQYLTYFDGGYMVLDDRLALELSGPTVIVRMGCPQNCELFELWLKTEYEKYSRYVEKEGILQRKINMPG